MLRLGPNGVRGLGRGPRRAFPPSRPVVHLVTTDRALSVRVAALANRLRDWNHEVGAVEMRKQRESERVAKVLVESLVGGATMAFLEVQANGEHDYNLTYADGSVVPVEVTESVDFQIECGVGALADERFVNANSCRRDWHVHPLPDARIDVIRNKVDQYLAAVEYEGLDQFHASRDAGTFPSVRSILEDLKIGSGSTAVWNPPGRIGIDRPSQHVMSRVDSCSAVLGAVEFAMSKKREKKFAALAALERHLFVYVHPRNYPAWVALIDSDVSAGQPSVKEWGGITDVWVAGPDRSQGVYVVWRCTVGHGWRNLGRVTI